MNYLGIEKEDLAPVAKKLNIFLSSYQIYYQNLRSFHWHIKGNNFFELHALFEDLYNDAKVKIDEIAERILTIRHKPMGNVSEYLEHSLVKEAKDILADKDMLTVTLNNHADLITCMRGIIKEASRVNDEGTVDLIAGMLGDMEKRSWMIDSWISRRFV